MKRMTRTMLKSKIHRATVTESDLDYEGSIAICPALAKAAGLAEYEKVLVANLANGHRFTTYVIRGRPRRICVNGAAARLACPGDEVIIMAFAQVEEAELAAFAPRLVRVDARNRRLAGGRTADA